MLTLPLDGDLAKVVPLRARLANRLARHVRLAPASYRSRSPLVSITFDDAPDSACARGADMLEAHGATGTYYISGGLIGRRALHWQVAEEAQIVAVHARGHEIGCHTYTHAFVPSLSTTGLERELAENRARLTGIIPSLALENFAFPYGYGSFRAKRLLKKGYASSRSITPGVNTGPLDQHYLRANPLIDGWSDHRSIGRLMDEALQRDGWVIFFGHDVAADPSPFGCAPALLETVLREAAARSIPCVSVAEALRRSHLPQAEARPQTAFAHS